MKGLLLLSNRIILGAKVPIGRNGIGRDQGCGNGFVKPVF